MNNKPTNAVLTNSDNIKDLHQWAREIAGEWDGDQSGAVEDRANAAIEVLDAIIELLRTTTDLMELC